MFITASKLANIVHKTPQAILYEIKKGKIKADKIGNRWLISLDEVRRILEGGIEDGRKKKSNRKSFINNGQ